MPTFRWKELLTRWSEEIIQSGRFADRLPPEVAASHRLGYPGATEEEIAAAETRLGTTFPPSYRAFLQVTNGWRMTTGFAGQLWPTGQVVWLADQDPDLIEAWMAAGEERVSDQEYFVYGEYVEQPLRAGYLRTALAISAYEDGIYLLNPQVVTPEGEWEAWFFAHWIPGADRYRSFWELMEAEHASFLHMLREERGEPTPRAHPSLGVEATDLEGLVAALEDPGRRAAALTALGNLRDRRAFEPVLAILRDPDEELFVREEAARTLGRLRDRRAARALIDALRALYSGQEEIRMPGMGQMEGLVGHLSIEELFGQLQSMMGGGLGQAMAARLDPQAARRGLADHLAHAIRQGLIALGEVGLPTLFEVLGDPDPDVRRVAATALFEALGDPDPDVQREAAMALSEALGDPDPDVRRQVAMTLCYARGQEGVLEHLRAALSDPDPRVRTAIVTNVDQLYDPRGTDLLLQALEDADPTVRLAAVKSLGIQLRQARDGRVVQALEALRQSDPDPNVRGEVARVLRNIGKG